MKLPDGKVLIPGVIESKSNFIEHPELIAQRIGRYAKLVGRENVIAGSDCGYGTWVGQAAVDPDVVWAKLAAMAEGARDRLAAVLEIALALTAAPALVEVRQKNHGGQQSRARVNSVAEIVGDAGDGLAAGVTDTGVNNRRWRHEHHGGEHIVVERNARQPKQIVHDVVAE